jgi:hypothetical protein
MLPKSMFIILVVTMLVTMGCGFTFTIPVTDVNTGPTVIDEIEVPVPEGAEVVDLTFGFGAGEIRLSPGDEDALVRGTAKYNVDDFKPEIITSGDRVRINTGDLEISGIPNFGARLENEWNFELAPVPMNLKIEAGAYQGRMELGGLALESLRVSDGASNVKLAFSKPNLVPMSSFRYDTGASSVTLEGLANANFGEMSFKGGVGEYTMDFSGELQRDATITIDSGISSIKIIVPRGVAAKVFFDGGLSNVDVDGSWEKVGDVYSTSGDGPRLTFNVNLGAGNLELVNR